MRLRALRGDRAPLLFGLALLAAIACAGPSRQEATASRASGFGTEPNEAGSYDGWSRHSVYVPMKDGVRIAVDTYLPTTAGAEATGPLPVILHYTRYIRAFEGEDGEVRGLVDNDPVLQAALRHGYAVAVADARGTGASFGVHNGAFSVEETRDSYEIVEWLAAQPWSNGKVGMQGRSYPGMTQYQAATQAPPALKAIFAEMAGPSPFDFVYAGGTFKQEFIEVWGNLTMQMDRGEAGQPARVDEDTDGALRAEAIAQHAQNLWAHEILEQNNGSEFRNWVDRRPNGALWSWETVGTIDNLGDLDSAGVAIYHLVGWYDIYTTQQPWLYASLAKTPQKMMIGPWVHSGGYGGEVHEAEFLRWYDYWLKGVDNGVMDEEPVHYYVMQGDHTLPLLADDEETTTSLDEERAEDPSTWAAAQSWPPATAKRFFYLGAGVSGTVASVNDGMLLEKAPAEGGRDVYRVDYTSAMGSFSRWMNGYGGRRETPKGTTFFDERTVEDRKALTYTSEPLEQDLAIVGYPVAHLWVTSSAEDGDFFVYLEEVDQEGRSSYVTEGALRASRRSTATPPWNDFGLPYHRVYPEDVAPLPQEPVELALDLMGTAVVIDAGHRIRITVAGADAANFSLYPDPKGVAAPTISLHRGGETGSFVEVPVLEATSARASGG